MKTLSYYYTMENDIRKGDYYLFGQLWDGSGDGEELLESGAIAVYGTEDSIVEFEVIEKCEADIMQSVVRVL